MTERQYSVRDTNGKYSPPIGERELFDYVRQGIVKPNTVVRDVTAGSEARAADYPLLVAIFRQQGVSTAPPPIPVPPSPLDPSRAAAARRRAVPAHQRLGKTVLIIGIVVLAYAMFAFDVTIPLSPDQARLVGYDRVANLQLMNNRVVMMIGGAVMAGIGLTLALSKRGLPEN